MFGVIIGTGTGGGIVVAAVLEGRIGSPASGDTIRCRGREDETPGPPCYCGRNGCIETFLSGPGSPATMPLDRRARVDAAEIARARMRVTPAPYRALAVTKTGSRAALASIINVLDPDVIVLGGRPVEHQPAVRTCAGALEPFVFSDHAETPLVARPPRRFERRAGRGLVVAVASQ